MTNFKQFKSDIKKIGKMWNTDNVYYSQMRDGYSVSYKPKYPESCINDMIIQTLEGTGSANRGNYELIIWEAGKYTSKYFDTIEEIKQFFNNQ